MRFAAVPVFRFGSQHMTRPKGAVSTAAAGTGLVLGSRINRASAHQAPFASRRIKLQSAST